MVKERNGHVVGIKLCAGVVGTGVVLVLARGKLARGVRIEHIRIPERKVTPATIEAAGLFPQPEKRVRPIAFPARHERIV